MSVGGVRVNRDSNHMSGTFGFLPGPYFARELIFLINVSALEANTGDCWINHGTFYSKSEQKPQVIADFVLVLFVD